MTVNAATMNFDSAPSSVPSASDLNPNLFQPLTIGSFLGDDSEAQFEEAVALIESTIAELTAEQPPVLSVEGISLGSAVSASTTVAQTSATQVSLITSSAVNAAQAFAEKTINGPMPEMLMLTRMPNIKKEVAIKNCKVSQAERKIVQEVLELGLAAVSESDAADAYASLSEENLVSMDEVNKSIDAMSSILTNAEIAASGFNIRGVQDQIMISAASKLTSIVQDSEGGNDSLSSTIEQHIQDFYPNNHPDDVASSNTTIILTLLVDTLRACESIIPASIPGVKVYKDSSRKPPPEAVKFAEVSYRPVCVGGSGKQTLPKTRDLCRPHLRSQLSIFESSTDIENSDLKNNRPVIEITKSNSNDKWANQFSEVVAINKHMSSITAAAITKIVAISNELITSAGIGRLSGSPLGNRFLLEHTPEEGLVQTRPYHKVLGEDPFSTKEKLERFHRNITTYKSGMTDLLALGEELDSKVVILPFEVRSVQEGDKYFLSGKKYFIESGLTNGPWQNLSVDDPNNLATQSRQGLLNYSDSFSQFTTDVSGYMNELLCLDSSTNLTPELILARILKDFSVVLSSINNTSEFRDSKSDAVAGMFARCNNSHNANKEWALPSRKTRLISFTDYLTGLAIATLNDYDQLLEDTSFKLNSDRTKITFTKLGRDDEEEFDDTSSGHFLNLTTLAMTHMNNKAGDGLVCHSPIGKDMSSMVGGQISCDEAGGLTTLNLDRDTISNFSMHDNTFSGGYNILNLMAVTIREIQSEALSLSKRFDADSDYRTSAAKTNYSGMDDDRFIRLIVEIYTNIAALVLPITTFARNLDSTADRVPGTLYSVVSRSSAAASQSVVDSILGSLISGEKITADSVSLLTGVNTTTKINSLKISKQDGDQNFTTTFPPLAHNGAGSKPHSYTDRRKDTGLTPISLIAAGCQKHRFGIKSSLKIIESVSDSVRAGVSNISTIFNILNQDDVDEASLTESETVLLNLVSSDNSQANLRYRDMLPITPEQLNLRKADYLNYLRQDSEDDFEMRSFISPTKQERDATLKFIETLWEDYASADGLQDFYVLTVGIPQGLIESLRHPFVDKGAQGPNLIGSDLSINVSRHDQVYGTIPSDGNTVYELDPLPIDPEIFILPGSIKYDPDTAENTVGVDGIHKQTTYYRIRSGKIIEEIQGTEENLGDAKLTSCLKSYLLDLTMYEIQRFRMYGLIDNNKDRISNSAKQFLDVVSSSEEMSKSILCKSGFINLFEPASNGHSHLIKSRDALANMLKIDPFTREQQFSSSDVLIANYLTCFSKLSEPNRILLPRPYDRVYNIVYNEATIRNRLWDASYNASSATEFNKEQTRAEARQNFDMFSLSVVIQSKTNIQ